MRYILLLAIPFFLGLTVGAHEEPIPPPRRVPDDVIRRREWPQHHAEIWNSIRELRASGKIVQVIPIAEKLVAIERNLLGAESWLLADSLAELAGMYRELENHQKAGRATLEAASIYAAAYGIGDWRVKDALLWGAVDQRAIGFTPIERDRYRAAWQAGVRGRAAFDRNEYRSALPDLKAATEAFIELLGRESYPAIYRLSDLGQTYTRLAEYKLASEVFGQCRQAIEKSLGKEHPQYANLLNSISIMLGDTGDHEGEIRLLKEALPINRKIYGDRSTDVAINLTNLGIAYHRIWDLAQAKRLLSEAVDIFREQLGSKAPAYAHALASLGNVHNTLGDYPRAEEVLREALAIHRTPSTLNNLAILYQAVGDVGTAARLMDESLAILRKTVGEKHPEYAIVLGNLAQIYTMAGLSERAVANYEQALAIMKERFGDRHPKYAGALTDLGLAYIRADQPRKADSVLQRAVEIQKAASRDRDPNYAYTLVLSALASATIGDLPRAERLAAEAMKVRTAVLGHGSPEEHLLLAQITAKLNRREEARAHFARALELEDRDLRAGLGFNTEVGMRLRLMMTNQTLDACLDFAASHPHDTAAHELALAWVLKRKATVLDIQCRYRELQRAMGTHPDVARQVASVRKAFDAYMTQLAQPVGKDSDAFRTEVNRLRASYDREEADLHALLDKLRPSSMTTVKEVTVAAVREQIPKGSVLVEFVEYAPRNLTTSGEGVSPWKPRRYLAFVLHPDPSTAPKLIDLGETAVLDRGIREFREALPRVLRELQVSDEPSIDNEFRELSAELSRRLFTPIRSALGDAKNVLLAPDGALNLLPFDALVDNDRYLIESFRFRYLLTGRDLLRVRGVRGKGTTVFAAPDFNWRPEVVAAPRPAPRTDQRLALRGVEAGQLRGRRFQPYPGMALEADDIRKILKGTDYAPVQMFTGMAARKNVFTAVRGPRILHVATHGFFTPDNSMEENAAPGSRSGRPAANPGLPPLLRSGLVFTGANQLTDPSVSAAGADEGWLTAEEVGLMDLRGTELVVLSACQSGLGDVVQAGEGVFGLRRAFLYAGAESLVVSLFEVRDTETRELMQFFYQRLSKGATQADALYEAKRELIARRRQQHKAAHPFFWASFILIGGDR